MFRVVRVWDDGDSTTFRYTDSKFDTRVEAQQHLAKLQHRFPKYLFWISEGDVRSRTVRITKQPDMSPVDLDPVLTSVN